MLRTFWIIHLPRLLKILLLSFYITNSKYHSSKAFMLIKPKGDCPSITKDDIEMDLEHLNQIHKEYKVNSYPNCPFPHTADLAIGNN